MKQNGSPFILVDEHKRIVEARETALKALYIDSRETSFIYGLTTGLASGILAGMLLTSWAVWYLAAV